MWLRRVEEEDSFWNLNKKRELVFLYTRRDCCVILEMQGCRGASFQKVAPLSPLSQPFTQTPDYIETTRLCGFKSINLCCYSVVGS